MFHSGKFAIAAFALGLCAAPSGLAQDAVQTTANWTINGGTPGNTHYSALKQIDRSNVSKLKLAWKFETGESGGLQTTPLIVDGILYAITPKQKIVALDGATGKLLWTFESGVNGTQPDRGLSWWTDGRQTRLLVGVMNFLYALDPKTGKPFPDFGKGGRIDLRENLGRPPELQSISLTSPGVIYKDMIIVGGRNPESLPAPPGDIRAFDVHTGNLRWAFHTIPRPGEFGIDTWPKDAWKTAGAANNWAGMAIDLTRGIVFVPTGSAVPDFYGQTRIGDDLFANTLLALDANTGKRIWHFQGVHHDMWDRDFPSAPVLVDVTHDGKTVPAIAQTTKQGYLYLFNRITGEPLFPIENRPYPPSTTPGEQASKTQPYPLIPEPFAPQKVTEANLTQRTPEAHAWAVKRLSEVRSDGQFVPLSVGKDTVVSPSFEGGAEWGGPAVDPEAQILYVNANAYASLGALAAHGGDSPGRSLYLSQCSICHGEYRAGSPPEFPPLTGIAKRESDDQIIATIHAGKGRMPAMPIEGDRLKQLLDYLKADKDTRGNASEEQAATAQPIATQASGPGAAVYQARCAICHGERREGIAPSFPTLIGVNLRYTDAQLLNLIHTGKGRMPPFTNISSTDMGNLLQFLHPPAAMPRADSAMQYTMTGYRRFNDPDGYPATAAPWGTLNALDLKTGKYLWKIPLGQYPALVAQGMPDTGSENYGGPIVTAGGLLFIGATNFDHKFRAFDKTTGKLLWETVMPFAGNATPATYEIKGKQYVVIASGGSSMNPGGPIGGVYMVYALP